MQEVLIRTLVMTQTSFLVLASLIWASVDITPFRQFALSFPWCHPQVAVFPRRGYGVANALYSSGGHFVRRPLDLGSVKYGNDDGDGIGECGSFPRIISCGCNDWTSRIDVACV